MGGRVTVDLGSELLAMVDAYAASRAISRAEAVRRLTQDAVTRARVNEAPLSPRDNR
jgi:metal-responsive CopG/Arc/MetJ family transcriptional regulator